MISNIFNLLKENKRIVSIKKKKTEEKARLYLKKLEEKLDYYKRVVINSSDAVIIQDFNGVVKAWNKSAERIYDYKAKEMIGKSIFKIIAKEDYSNAKKNILAIKKGKPTFKVKQIRKTKDNQKVFVNITYSPIYENEEIIEIATTEEDVTKLKKSIAEIKSSELRYRKLFETTQDAVLLIDPISGKIIDANPYIKDLLGYPNKEIIGKKLWNISPLKDIVSNKKRYMELKRIGHIHYEDLPLETKSGKIVYVEFLSNIYKIDHTNLIQCNIRNITERKKAEDELRSYKDHLEEIIKEKTKKLQESEEKYKVFFIYANDAIFIADTKTKKLIDCNKAAEKLTGFTKKELMSMHAYNLHPKYLVKQTMEDFKKQVLGEIDVSETEILTKNKKIIPVSINAGFINISGKKYLQGIFRDISIRKEAQERYKILYQSSSDAIMTLEPPSWRFTAGNDSAVKMFNCKNEEEFISKTPYELSPKYQSDGKLSNLKAKEMINLAMKNGSNFFEWTHKRCKNGDFPATVLLTRVNLLGKTFLQATVRDITKEKKAEEDLKNAYEKLKELDVMKTEFLSSIFHELRTPLTPIISQLQRLISKKLPKQEERSSLDMVMRNSIRLDKLINEILEISRMRSNRLVLIKKKDDIKELVLDAVKTMQSFARDRKSKILYFSDKIPKISFDRERIYEVLINLIDNAIKFNGGSNIIIHIKKIKNEIVVSVKDKGIGISKKDFEYLFKPFFRSQKTYVYKGSGLGLSICKGIIEAHNGRIWFDSKLSKGSTFYFSLPIKKVKSIKNIEIRR